MKFFYLLIVTFIICGCNDTTQQESHEPSAEFMLLTGEWKNLSMPSNSNDDWLENSSSLYIGEKGIITNKEGQTAQADLQDSILIIEKEGVTSQYKIKYDAGFFDLRMITDDNKKTPCSLFQRVQNTLVGVWDNVSETSFHQVDADGWANNDWIWSFQGTLSFYNNYTCINEKGEMAKWEMKDSTLTITYKEDCIDWTVIKHHDGYNLKWKKEREGFANKDLHNYQFVSASSPTFSQTK